MVLYKQQLNSLLEDRSFTEDLCQQKKLQRLLLY